MDLVRISIARLSEHHKEEVFLLLLLHTRRIHCKSNPKHYWNQVLEKRIVQSFGVLGKMEIRCICLFLSFLPAHPFGSHMAHIFENADESNEYWTVTECQIFFCTIVSICSLPARVLYRYSVGSGKSNTHCDWIVNIFGLLLFQYSSVHSSLHKKSGWCASKLRFIGNSSSFVYVFFLFALWFNWKTNRKVIHFGRRDEGKYGTKNRVFVSLNHDLEMKLYPK